jgi:pentatricopeptide repeat protein
MGNIGAAYRLFDGMRAGGIEPNDVIYGCLIDACVKGSEMEMALELLDMMKESDVKPNVIIYSTMIKGFARTHQLDAALA